MKIEQALNEWKSKNRRMGCVASARWFCKRVPGFKPLRLKRWTDRGEVFEHVVSTDGVITIDLAPYNDRPSDKAIGNWK